MKLFIHLDETDPRKPVAILTVNGHEVRLSDCELRNLRMEIMWAQDHISEARKAVWSGLANKYKEIPK